MLVFKIFIIFLMGIFLLLLISVNEDWYFLIIFVSVVVGCV